MQTKEQKALKIKLEAELAQLSHDIMTVVTASTQDDYSQLQLLLLTQPQSLWPELLEGKSCGSLKQKQQRLEQVLAALGQFQMGLFGLCAQCDSPISPEALNHDPATLLCDLCLSQKKAGTKSS
ncbi:MAG TPA: hypothetical protein VJ795_03615 [Rheinheimera sp.]|uniref:hypothetical protein n=1 Tax=Rheinheimera sp. TaxID=1869214 RepID=UPI002B47384C|nr:hypothetical protein [Rheinheimera sp.]HJS14135.1 hypothetical protein [Rheinheimera sp.]